MSNIQKRSHKICNFYVVSRKNLTQPKTQPKIPILGRQRGEACIITKIRSLTKNLVLVFFFIFLILGCQFIKDALLTSKHFHSNFGITNRKIKKNRNYWLKRQVEKKYKIHLSNQCLCERNSHTGTAQSR